MTPAVVGSTPTQSPRHHYIVIRRDLPIGVLAAQVAHAAARSGPHDERDHVVILAVADEVELATVASSLAEVAVDHVQIFEPDPPWCGSLMAIGVRPMVRLSPIRALARLRLLTQASERTR